MTEPLPTEDGEDEDKDNELGQLQEDRDGFRQVYNKMTDKLEFPSGRCLEDSMYKYAINLNKRNLAHFCIVDSKMLSTLDESERQQVLSRVLPLAPFPKYLNQCLSRYDGVR